MTEVDNSIVTDRFSVVREKVRVTSPLCRFAVLVVQVCTFVPYQR